MSELDGIEFEESSGNVFEDIGFDHATAQRLTRKAELVGVLRRYQEQLDLTQGNFGKLIGIPQPRLSKLYRGKIAGMSTDKLLDAVAILGGYVKITVDEHPDQDHAGKVEVALAG
jgi:predicted XRE-type DNA-binding protein